MSEEQRDLGVFEKGKKQTQKGPFKIQKSKIIFKSKKVRKLTLPNVAILIPKTFFQISKSQKQTKKDPIKILVTRHIRR